MLVPCFRCFYVVIALCFLCGCATVGVDYESPDVSIPDAWVASLEQDLKGNSSLEKWWRGFGDPTLNRLIEQTRKSNPNLRIASQRVAEARALRGVARSQLFPTIDATGDAVRNRASESLLAPVPENPSNLYSAGFDAGWEVDVFGGLRRNVESTEANLEASVEEYRDLLVTLLAETALNYVEYRTLQERIRLAEENIEAQEDSVQITEGRLSAGLSPRIDVTQAKTNLETSRSLLPALGTQLTLARNRMAALNGGFPGSMDKLLSGSGSIPEPGKSFAVNSPANLLRARADIRKAERELAAQTARIGVAEADLYPRFFLFGNLSLQSIDSSDFFESQSRAYSFGPGIRWQIFSAGRIRSNINIEEARTEQALANYENSVLLAVEEVESSMAAAANERIRSNTLDLAVESARETVSLVKGNYKSGLIDFQRVLDAERTKFSTEDEAAVSKGQIAKNYVQLFKALGGGSEVEVVPIQEPKTKVRGTIFGRNKRSSESGEGESIEDIEKPQS